MDTEVEVIVKQTYRFIITGAIASLCNYSLFVFSYLVLNFHYVLSSIIGFLIVSLAVYHVRKRWVFVDTYKKKKYQYFSFMILEIVSLSSGVLALYMLTEFASINPLISQLFSIILTAAINFLGNKYIIF